MDNDLKLFCELISGKTILFVPETIYLLGEKWNIEINNEIEANGLCYYKNKKIKIKSQNNADRTLLHEIIHSRNKIFGYSHNETEVRLEALFWRDVFKQIYPITELWKKVEGKMKFQEDEKDKLIKKLQKRVKYLENKLGRLK